MYKYKNYDRDLSCTGLSKLHADVDILIMTEKWMNLVGK